MISRPHINTLSFVLLVVHLGVVYWVYKENFEGSWGGFLLFVIDFPISLLGFIPVWNEWFFFSVVGSLWWYWIGTVISSLIAKIIRREM